MKKRAERYRLRRFVEALRVLAQTSDPYRAVLIENAINEYLKTDPGRLRLSLERLCDAIERQEAEKRRGEGWSIAKDYVLSRGFIGTGLGRLCFDPARGRSWLNAASHVR
jgi:hypothetical protein